MVFPQSGPLRFNIPPGNWVVFSHLLPVIAKVALDAVPALQLKIALFDLLQKRGVVPSGAVVNGGDIGGGAHGTEFPGVFLFGDILGLINLQQISAVWPTTEADSPAERKTARAGPQPDDIAISERQTPKDRGHPDAA